MANPDDRSLTYDEQVARKAALVADELVLGLRDGRAVIRANAALGLAALGHTGSDLVPFLRDSHPVAARAAAEAISHLGTAQRAHLVAIAAALDGARPEVMELIVSTLATMVGHADPELLAVLDTSEAVPAIAVIEACARVGVRGLRLLQLASTDARARVRWNAVRGIGQLADLDPVTSIEAMRAVAYGDSVADVRGAALTAIAGYMARTRSEAAARRRAGQPVPAVVPELTTRALTPDELRKASALAPLDELMLALLDARVEIRLNAVRVLALQGPAAATAAAPLGVATRDRDATVRAESARAIGAIGDAGVLAAPALVRALGDDDAAVNAAAEAVLAAQGPAATAALLDGLSVTREAHGARVAGLLGKLPDGAALLRDALASTSVDVRVNAAVGLGALGPARAAAAVPALYAATRGGNARSRAAVARAVEQLAPRPDRSPPPLAIDGFDARVLPEAELAKHQAALTAVGIAGLVPRLGDVNVATRANTALAFGVLGDAAGVRDAVAICLRDDAVEVRLGAARALVRLGDAAIAACAELLVRALGHADASLAAQLTTMLRAATQPEIVAALADGLDTEDDHRARQLLELITARPDAAVVLGAAFARPGAQAHAARGFVALGAAQLRGGRAVLERARTDSAARVRDLARATLLAIDGVPAGPVAPAVPGFETELLEHKAFAKLHIEATALVPFLADARAAPRANAATGLGALGAAAAPHALTVAALLRDDDDRVRVAAARALDLFGDDAVVAVVPALVAALRGSPAVAAACHAALASRGARIEAALLAGLETDDETYGMRILELIYARPNAAELLSAAFASPGAQAHAAGGFVALGEARLGGGRAVLERARTDSAARVRDLARATLLAIDGVPAGPVAPAVPGFETELLEHKAFAKLHIEATALLPFLADARAAPRANAATGLGALGAAAAPHALTVAALLRDDDDRVRVAAARALDLFGDDAVVAVVPALVAALRGSPAVAAACHTALASRGARIEAALLAGLETDDETHGMRIAELICTRPNARTLLFAAFDGPAENVQINAAFGIAMLGVKVAGPEGRLRLLDGLPGPPTRRRYAMIKALRMLGAPT